MTVLILTIVFGVVLFPLGLGAVLYFYKKSKGTLVGAKSMKGGKGQSQVLFPDAIMGSDSSCADLQLLRYHQSERSRHRLR